MLKFISSKLVTGTKAETCSEGTSQAGEKGFGMTSNQSEFSESVMVVPSENPELNESADQIVLSQLQRENEDLKECLRVLKTREVSATDELAKLEREKIQLYRVMDQLYTLHSSHPPKISTSEVHGEDEVTPYTPTVTAGELDEAETVRDMLRNASTVNDLEKACEKAKKLGMNFEVSLAERKLAKLNQ